MFIFFFFLKKILENIYLEYFLSFSIVTIITIVLNGHVYERYISVAKGLLEKRMVNETRIFDDNLVEKREYPKTIKDLSIIKQNFMTPTGVHII